MAYQIVENNGRLEISFSSTPVYWERPLSKLVENEVILDLENAKKLLKEKGDQIVYTVYDLWEFDNQFKEFYEKTKVKTAITLLRYGVFSTETDGELFCTFGHIHEKPRGELYEVLKGECFLLLSDPNEGKSYLLNMREGTSAFIHPRFWHRLIVKSGDCAVIGYVPKDAGHNYEIIKQHKGFPFHIFKENSEYVIKKNPNYQEPQEIHKIDAKPIGIEKIFEELPHILYNPDDHKQFYTLQV